MSPEEQLDATRRVLSQFAEAVLTMRLLQGVSAHTSRPAVATDAAHAATVVDDMLDMILNGDVAPTHTAGGEQR